MKFSFLSSLFTFLFILGITSNTVAQKKDYKVACLAFYNLENLFDTVNDTLINDEQFLPEGSYAWTEDRYQEKLANMAYVISKLGTELSPTGASVVGVSEIENRKVLEDLVAHDLLKERNYKIVHYDSPDKRGIDVALLYQPGHFKVTDSQAIPLMIYRGEKRVYTRDMLHVEGLFDGEPMHFIVNHWPSRRGGAAQSAPFRNEAAKTCKKVLDSLENLNPGTKLILMGDFNDDPVSPSVKSHLMAKKEVEEVSKGGFYNPMESFYSKGIGSNAWRDTWSLFDQLILSEGFLNKSQSGYFYYQAHIYNKNFLRQKSGQYKGYPFRTYSGGKYTGGYSDHFPVFVYLLKAI